MDIYMSQLDETKIVLPIIEKYNIGLEVVQFASPYILDRKEEYIESYKKELGHVLNNIDISIHGPYADLIPGTRDKVIANVTEYRFNQAYSIAKEFRAKKIVYHNGYTPKTYTYTEWLNNSLKFWKEFTKDKLDDMEIHIENVMEEDYFLINELIDEINHPNFSVCLDIGHVNTYSNVDLRKWIDVLGKKIKHLHIHNNYGDRDSHFGINKGNMNVIEILELIQEELKGASVSLEIVNVGELKESLEILDKYGILNNCIDIV